MSRGLKRALGAVIGLLGLGLVVAFVLSKAWFGVMIGAFIALLGGAAFFAPDDVFPAQAKELPVRGRYITSNSPSEASVAACSRVSANSVALQADCHAGCGGFSNTPACKSSGERSHH